MAVTHLAMEKTAVMPSNYRDEGSDSNMTNAVIKKVNYLHKACRFTSI